MTTTLDTLRRRALTLADRLRFLPPLLARIAVGLVFVNTGWGKLHDLESVTGFFRELGIPWPELQVPFVAATELVCGALVLVGLSARLAAIPLVGTMAVAIAIAGPGAVSLDALLVRLVDGGLATPGTARTAARA